MWCFVKQKYGAVVIVIVHVLAVVMQPGILIKIREQFFEIIPNRHIDFGNIAASKAEVGKNVIRSICLFSLCK